MNDRVTEEMVQKLSAERVRLVHENEKLRSEIKRLSRQVDTLTEALADQAEDEPPTELWFPGVPAG